MKKLNIDFLPVEKKKKISVDVHIISFNMIYRHYILTRLACIFISNIIRYCEEDVCVVRYFTFTRLFIIAYNIYTLLCSK